MGGGRDSVREVCAAWCRQRPLPGTLCLLQRWFGVERGGEGLGVCTMLRMLIQPPCMKCTIFLQQTAESSCTPWAFGTPGVPIWYHPHLDLQTDCGPRHPRRTPRAASLAPSIHRCKRWNPETRGCGARPSRPEPAHGSASPLSLPVGRRSCCGWAPPPQPDGRPAGLAGGAGTAGRDRLAGRGPLAEAVRLLPSAAAVPHVCPLVKSAGRRCDYPAAPFWPGAVRATLRRLCRPRLRAMGRWAAGQCGTNKLNTFDGNRLRGSLPWQPHLDSPTAHSVVVLMGSHQAFA